MVDNVSVTAGSGTSVASDDIGGVHYQRVKVSHGADGSATDVSSASPMPVYGPDVTATGTITTTDAVVAAPAGAGAFVSGASTAGSLVAVQCLGGDTAWNVQVTALTSGTLYFEGSLDSTTGTDGNWINVNGRQTGIVNTVLAGNATANGMWRGNTSGLRWFRVRSVGALSGTPAIRIHISDGTGAIFLNASIPAGSNLIGSVNDRTDGTRFARSFILDAFTAAPVAEAMQSVVQWYANAAVAATVSPAVVPANRRLRLTSWFISTNSLATVGSAVVRVRANTSGTAVLASPLVATFSAGSKAGATTVAMTGGHSVETGEFPEGTEFAAGTGIGFSLAGYGPTGTLTLQGVTRFMVHGYEYAV